MQKTMPENHHKVFQNQMPTTTMNNNDKQQQQHLRVKSNKFHVGDRVVIQNLKRGVQHNGRHGTIIKDIDKTTGRYHVQLDFDLLLDGSGENYNNTTTAQQSSILVKPANIMKISSYPTTTNPLDNTTTTSNDDVFANLKKKDDTSSSTLPTVIGVPNTSSSSSNNKDTPPKMPIKELQAIAHGAGHNTAGLERCELEELVAKISFNESNIQKQKDAVVEEQRRKQQQQQQQQQNFGNNNHVFHIGDRVVVQNLVNSSQFNGKHGTIKSIDEITGRYIVDLDIPDLLTPGGQTINVKLEKLIKEEEGHNISGGYAAATTTAKQQQQQQQQQKMSIKELQSIAHGAGYSTAGMERNELESLVNKIKSKEASIQRQKDAAVDEQRKKQQQQEEEQQQHHHTFHTFNIGDYVIIQNLVSASEYNGSRGIIRGYDNSTERYHVDLEGSTTDLLDISSKLSSINVKADKLRKEGHYGISSSSACGGSNNNTTNSAGSTTNVSQEAAKNNKIPIKDLQAIAHGAGYSTAGMERAELEELCEKIKQKDMALKEQKRKQEENQAWVREQLIAKREEELRLKEEELRKREEHDKRVVDADREADNIRKRKEDELRRKEVELRRKEHELQQRELEQKRKQKEEEETRRRLAEEQLAAELARKRQQEEEERRRRLLAEQQQAAAAAEMARRRQQEEEQRRQQQQAAAAAAAAEQHRRYQEQQQEMARKRQQEEEERKKRAAAEQQQKWQQHQAQWWQQQQQQQQQQQPHAAQQTGQQQWHQRPNYHQQQHPQTTGPTPTGTSYPFQTHPPQGANQPYCTQQTQVPPSFPGTQQQYSSFPNQNPQVPPPQHHQQQPRPTPQPAPAPPPPPPPPYQQAPASPASMKYAKMADQSSNNSGEASETTIKRNLLVNWALQPPTLQVLRPIHELVSTIHTVFPPAYGITSHDYFSKWTPIPKESLGMSSAMKNTPDETKIKKAVRKLRFFLHPDRLPKDLTDDQSYLCKMAWDITSDAWDEYEKRKDELSWAH